VEVRGHRQDARIFSGYRALLDLGSDSLGRHRGATTPRKQAPGVEANRRPKPYEFRPTVNLTRRSTCSKASSGGPRCGGHTGPPLHAAGVQTVRPIIEVVRGRRRSAPETRIHVNHEDPSWSCRAVQELLSAVLMLTVRHRMSLYGEDSISPPDTARGAGAGADDQDAVSTKTGDASGVLFPGCRREADSARRVDGCGSGRTTPTRVKGSGGRDRNLDRQRKDMQARSSPPRSKTKKNRRQAVGVGPSPTARSTRRNAFASIPLESAAKRREVVARLPKSGIILRFNTFMLERRLDWFSFVPLGAELQGQAYFTTPTYTTRPSTVRHDGNTGQENQDPSRK